MVQKKSCLLTFDGPEEIIDKVRKRFGEVEGKQATAADKLAVTLMIKVRTVLKDQTIVLQSLNMMMNHRKFSSRP